MHLFSILHVFGTLLTVTGISMILPMICSIIYAEGDFRPFLFPPVSPLRQERRYGGFSENTTTWASKTVYSLPHSAGSWYPP
jgi:hypothetical protein